MTSCAPLRSREHREVAATKYALIWAIGHSVGPVLMFVCRAVIAPVDFKSFEQRELDQRFEFPQELFKMSRCMSFQTS